MRIPDSLSRHPRRCFLSLLYLVGTTLVGGCTAIDPPSSAPESIPAAVIAAPEQEPEYVQVVRYGRYTLAELAPAAAQRDLMLQVIDVAVPNTLHATVGDGLRHVLLRSGYRLCDRQDHALLALLLPAAHYRLGPVTLRDALHILAGPAWELHVDDVERQVCFSLSSQIAAEPQPLSGPEPGSQAEVFPLVLEGNP